APLNSVLTQRSAVYGSMSPWRTGAARARRPLSPAMSGSSVQRSRRCCAGTGPATAGVADCADRTGERICRNTKRRDPKVPALSSAATATAGRSVRRGVDRDELPRAAAPLETHHAIDQREQRVILPAAHVLARVELGSTLPDQDVAGKDVLPAEALHAEPLRVRVAAVPAGADSLLVRHSRPPQPRRTSP